MKSLSHLTKIAAIIICSLFTLSCEYDDLELWQAVEDVEERVKKLEEAATQTNKEIAALKSLVNALENAVSVTSVTQTEEGYTILFSDGTTATLTNGKNGTNAPEISVKEGEDGRLYWTLNGEFLTVGGNLVCAQGEKGADGEKGDTGTAPKIRINSESKEWEISYDNGTTWESTGIVAEGNNTTGEGGSSIFKEVDITDPDFVTVTLSDGTQIKLSRYDDSAPTFAIEAVNGQIEVEFGATVEFEVISSNIKDFSISKPDGWRASFKGDKLSITAPAAENNYAEVEGTIAINMVSESGKSLICKIEVKAIEAKKSELRILTFEAADAKFSSYTVTGFDGMDYYEITINDWNDLIDAPEYGGPMIYGDMGFNGMGQGCDYHWYDENNTFLASELPVNYNARVYWSGGHVVSNYASEDYTTYGTYNNQQTVYGEGQVYDVTRTGGYNGSANFAMHYGYIDGSPYNMTENLPYIYFGDGVARTIDHMYVNNSCYAINCYMDGNGLTAKIGEGDWVKALATGYDADGNVTGTSEFYLCNGPDHIITEWTKWDLRELGKPLRVEFNITGSSDNGYGFSQPAYFAYDNVAVVVEAE